jgi:hypothetical protein
MTRTTLRPTTPRGTALRAGASVAVLASGALLLLSACGSSSGSSSASSTTSGTAASASASASGKAGGSGVDAQAMSKYRDCLTQHGVTLPSFSPGAGRPSGAPSGRPSGRPSGPGGGGRGGFGGFGGASADPKTAAAMKACDSLRPQFNGQRGGADSTAFKAFTSCLKDHGVTLPTPSPGATGTRAGGFGGTRGLNTSDPKTAKAYNTCRALLPQRPSGAPTSTPS